MASFETTAHTTPEPSATELLKRDVASKIRNLTPGQAPIMALVSRGEIKDGELSNQQSGLMRKRKSFALRVEGFTFTPLPQTKVVASVSGLDITLSDTNGVALRQMYVNTANQTVGRVDAISGSVVTFITIGGTTFSASADNTLQLLGNSYKEGSSSPAVLQKTDDNFYNVMQTFRFPVEIANEAMPNPQLAGGDYFERMKKNNLIYALRSIENSFLWGTRATGTANKTSSATLSESVHTMRGLWGFAAQTHDFGSSMTPGGFRKNMVLTMDASINPGKKLVMLTSYEAYGRMIEWANDKLLIMKEGTFGKFGVKSTTFVTARNDIEVIVHQSFNEGANTNKAVIFCPEDNEYIHMDKMDIRPNTNIQAPDSHSRKDEITAVLSMLPLDSGKNITRVVNMF